MEDRKMRWRWKTEKMGGGDGLREKGGWRCVAEGLGKPQPPSQGVLAPSLKGKILTKWGEER